MAPPGALSRSSEVPVSSPNIVYIDKQSAPRVMFSGDNLIEVDLPVGTRCIYAKPPLAGVPDVDAAIRYASHHPYSSAPLYAKLKPGMKVVIAVDDISLPLPPMKRPDVRQRMLEIVLEMLADHGVEDIEIIIAVAYHRHMTDDEIKHITGDAIFKKYAPNRLYNFDAEDTENLTYLGKTEGGEEVEISRAAAESDLIIYLNINLVPMNGGHKSVGIGLMSGRTINANHNPYTLTEKGTYMDPDDSPLHRSLQRIGRLVEDKLDIFHIETTVNNEMFDRNLDFIPKNPDEYTTFEKMKLRAVLGVLRNTPANLRGKVFDAYQANYKITGVFAGDAEEAHRHAIDKAFEQYLVQVEGQADIQITGIPYISPYNVHSFLNPLLVQCMAQGYFHNMYRNKPLLKEGGTLIITHPLTDYFDPVQHACYAEFVHKILTKTQDDFEIHKQFEKEFSRNPAYIRMYRHGNAFHPNHPFYMWYWGAAGRRYQGRCIVVGADNEYMPKLMGYETAPTMAEAIRMAKETAPADPQITCINFAPIMLTEVL